MADSVDGVASVPIHTGAGLTQLVEFHGSGETHSGCLRVGTEYEKFVYHADDFSPLWYRHPDGRPGIRTLLDTMVESYGWEPVVDHGEVILLLSDDGSIALEPGGQLEISGQPYATIHETKAELDRHLVQLKGLGQRHNVRFGWLGAQPVCGLGDLDWMPKKRYGIMKAYLPTRGKLAHHMMKTTCTVQANLDYRDEADMARKVRMSAGVGAIVSAMFANSPLVDGKAAGYATWRAAIWQQTDPDRTGIPEFFFTGDGPSYEEYVRHALAVPMFFIKRAGEYVSCAGLPFSEFLKHGHKGYRATMADWELHLSSLFPAVRLKTYIETRTADCVAPELIPACPALWKGLFYDRTALDAAWDLVKGWSQIERLEHRRVVPIEGLKARTPKGYQTLELARELLKIAEFGLKEQAKTAGIADESIYLAPLKSLLERGKSPADVLMDWCEENQPTDRQLMTHVTTDHADA